MENKLTIDPITGEKDEISKTKELLNKVWPRVEHFNEDYLNWEYNQNPLGKAVGYNAFFDGRIVGHYVTQPVKAVIDGAPEMGLLSLNTAVHPDFRGRNIFQKLARKTYENAIIKGYKFVYGVSNKNSTLIFLRSLKFNFICQLNVKIGIGNIMSWLDNNEAAVSFRRIWDKETLNWRINKPGNSYYRRSSASGSVLFSPTSIYGISAQLCAAKNAELFKNIKKSWRMIPLSVWIGIDNGVNKNNKAPFFELPNRFRPSPLNLIFRDLTHKNRILKKENVKISLLDFDAY